MNKINIIYLGYDINTLILINQDKDFNIQGVATIDDFTNYKTYNVNDIIFKLIYYLHKYKKFNFLKNKLNKFYQKFYFFSSKFFKKYKDYLNIIITSDLPIIELSKIENKNIDLFIVNNWWLLTNDLILVPKYGCINIHPSKLPKYRGSLPTLWSLKNLDKESSVTYMLLDESMDGGKIISQHDFIISKNDNAIDLEKKIENIIQKNFLNNIKEFLNKKIIPREQELYNISKTGNYYKYMIIDFYKENSKDIFNKIILYPYLNPIDKSYSINTFKKKIFFSGAELGNYKNIEKGKYQIYKNYLYIGCNNGTIKFKLFKNINTIDSILFYLKLIKF